MRLFKKFGEIESTRLRSVVSNRYNVISNRNIKSWYTDNVVSDLLNLFIYLLDEYLYRIITSDRLQYV